jgi:Leucine-rich repeat (LRR) protein
MERGGLTSSIPSEIGNLSNLIFLDLDFNDLSGSIPTELFLLTGLTQLDVNNNRLSGNVDQIGVFEQLEFLQIHANLFTGEIPDSMGDLTRMTTFTLHENLIPGAMPDSVCGLLDINGGVLSSLIADCGIPFNGLGPEIICDCCTDCRD